MYIGASKDFRHFFILRELFTLPQGNVVLLPDPLPFHGPYYSYDQLPVPYWVAKFPDQPQTLVEWIPQDPGQMLSPQQQLRSQISGEIQSSLGQWATQTFGQTLNPHQQWTAQTSSQTVSAFRQWTPQMRSSYQQWKPKAFGQTLAPRQQWTPQTARQRFTTSQQWTPQTSGLMPTTSQQWKPHTSGQMPTTSQQLKPQTSGQMPTTIQQWKPQTSGQMLTTNQQWTPQTFGQIPNSYQQWTLQSSSTEIPNARAAWNPPNANLNPDRFPFKCVDCHFSQFSTRRGLATHTKTMHNRMLSPLNCELCEQSSQFSSRNELRAHSLEKHPNALPYPCNYCPSLFRNKEAKDAHERSHPKLATRYTCKLCGKKYRERAYLRRHYKDVHFGKFIAGFLPKGYDTRDLFSLYCLGYGLDLEMD